MQMWRWMIVAAAILAAAPAAAQTYDSRGPVCMQRWQWGGSYYLDCGYVSWDQCRAASVGHAAMCLDNPYWPKARSKLTGRVTR